MGPTLGQVMIVEEKTTNATAFDPESIADEIKSISVDRLVVDGLLFSYLDEFESKNPEAGQAIRLRLHEDESFLKMAQAATLDAIVFSTFANTVDNRVFDESLEQIKPLTDEPDLLLMRKVMFDFGVELAGLTSGGSPATGRLKERSLKFHEAAEAS